MSGMVLLGVSCILTHLIGDIGFQGDDWWILSFPYWNSFPQSVWMYAKASLRPVEGIYWISLFELLGINRTPYVFASLVLNVLSSTLFAVSLVRLFPEVPRLGVWASFFSFFMPMNAPLVFILHTDNSRLSMIFFWASVICMQSAGLKNTLRIGLVLIFYLLSVLTYENASLLIFALPFFVCQLSNKSGEPFRTKLFFWPTLVVMALGFLGFLAIRFLLFSGGAVNHASVVPSFSLLLTYCRRLLEYLVSPFRDMSLDALSLSFGVMVGVLCYALSTHKTASEITAQDDRRGYSRHTLLLIGGGVFVFFMGVAPYMLAGYSADFGFTGQSRVYSSGSFGVAMILAAIFSHRSSSKFLGSVVRLAGVLLLATMAAFQCDLRKDWINAAEIRKTLCLSLKSIVPRVKNNSTLLFLDLQSYVGNRAVIFQGVDGLDQYVKMLYNDKTLHGYFLYTRGSHSSSDTERTATISPEGIRARGSAPHGLAPLETVIIIRSDGNHFSLINSVSQEDAYLDAQWEGVSKVYSQTERIVKESAADMSKDRCLY